MTTRTRSIPKEYLAARDLERMDSAAQRGRAKQRGRNPAAPGTSAMRTMYRPAGCGGCGEERSVRDYRLRAGDGISLCDSCVPAWRGELAQ